MAYKVPKAIAQHPAVADCRSGAEGDSEKRHDVLLWPNWQFTRNTPVKRVGFFNSAREFLDAQPRRLP